MEGRGMIRLAKISKEYDLGGGKTFCAVRDVNITVREGEFLSILGPSGCGKTTILDMMGGISRATSGSVIKQSSADSGKAFTAMVFQSYALFPWLNVHDNIEFGLKIRGFDKRVAERRISKYLRIVGLERFKERYPSQLSGGMKQRVGIARALALEPSVLLMDEPFASVDAQTRTALQLEILKIFSMEKITIVFVTHSIEEALLLSDRVVVMGGKPGRVISTHTIKMPKPRTAEMFKTNEFMLLQKRIRKEIGAAQV